MLSLRIEKNTYAFYRYKFIGCQKAITKIICEFNFHFEILKIKAMLGIYLKMFINVGII